MLGEAVGDEDNLRNSYNEKSNLKSWVRKKFSSENFKENFWLREGDVKTFFDILWITSMQAFFVAVLCIILPFLALYSWTLHQNRSITYLYTW